MIVQQFASESEAVAFIHANNLKGAVPELCGILSGDIMEVWNIALSDGTLMVTR